jgi:hypothetical protein
MLRREKVCLVGVWLPDCLSSIKVGLGSSVQLRSRSVELFVEFPEDHSGAVLCVSNLLPRNEFREQVKHGQGCTARDKT